MIKLPRNRLQRYINTVVGFTWFMLALGLVGSLEVDRIGCATFLKQLLLTSCVLFSVYITLSYVNYCLMESYRTNR